MQERKHQSGVTFADVAGLDNEVTEVAEIVEYMRNPQIHRNVGAASPNAVLLYGSPCTGKALLAQAVAGEADVDRFSGLQRVRLCGIVRRTRIFLHPILVCQCAKGSPKQLAESFLRRLLLSTVKSRVAPYSLLMSWTLWPRRDRRLAATTSANKLSINC